jgi:hypothetical protein
MLAAVRTQTASNSETSVNFYQTARSNNPEDSHIHTRRRENLKYHSVNVMLAAFYWVSRPNSAEF